MFVVADNDANCEPVAIVGKEPARNHYWCYCVFGVNCLLSIKMSLASYHASQRNLFPEDNFRDTSINGLALKSLLRDYSLEADELMDWMVSSFEFNHILILLSLLCLWNHRKKESLMHSRKSI